MLVAAGGVVPPPVADVATTVEISHAEEAATLDAEIAGLQMDE